MTEQIEAGIYRQSLEDYHAGPGLSKSRMVKLFGPQPKAAQETLDDGTMFHGIILEPDKVDDRFVVLPDDCRPGSGTGMKARKEEFLARADVKGQMIVKAESLEMYKKMQTAVWAHPKVRELELLQDGESELSAYWRDPEFENVLLKCRPDYANQKKYKLTDLKSTKDCTERAFKNQCYNLHYDLQCANDLYIVMKLTGVVHEYYFVAVNKKPGYDFEDKELFGVMVYKAEEDFISSGLMKRAKAIKTYLECLESGIWPGYDKDVKPLNLPGWVRQMEGYEEIIE